MTWTPEEKQKYIDELKASMEEQKSAEKDVTSSKAGKKILIAGCIVAAIAIMIGLVMPSFNGDSGTPATAPATETHTFTQELIEIGAGQLYQEYKTNEIAADLKYEGKFLKVHGIVRSIGEDIMGTPYVVIVGNEGDVWGVQCMCPDTHAYRQELAKLSPGQEACATGKCKGHLIGNVLLEVAVGKPLT